MRTTSLYLGEVNIQSNAEELVPSVAQGFTDIAEYSRFKFGDGEAGAKYGRMLGDLVLSEAVELLTSEDVYVASSAFRTAPPASESLVAPFIDSARAAAGSVGSGTAFNRFKISKARLATDNYAAMSFEERSKTLQSDLILPEGLDLRGKRVVILDDIRVTGLREAALKDLLGETGAEHTSFYYVLSVPRGKEYPQTEAVINIRSVKTIDDILTLAEQPTFVPNIRLCKFILTRPVDDLERFCQAAPQNVVDTVLHYIRADNLEEVVKAIP